MSAEKRYYTLDPVTFEVLKNAFSTSVDLMAEQILRTCHSFVIYARDFSSSLCDRHGDTVMQGSQDIAVHVGTLHYTAKAVIDAFGEDIHPGDVFAINDPYLGGTHFNDVRIVRPVFHGGEIIAFAQSNGHWADMGGSVPGSFDVNAKEHFAEGVRIPPVRLWEKGRYLWDVARLILSNTRAAEDTEGDLQAQAEATRVCEREILRLVEKYGRDTILTAFGEVQDYVERLTRQRVAALPDGTWQTEDYLDFDPDRGEGLVPIKVKLTIEGDQMLYDLSGSHPTVGTFLNAAFGSATSAVVAGTKTFFPDVPLNAGFYRAVQVDLGPEGSVVNAPLAGRGDRLLLRPLREDHERDLRDLVTDHARTSDRLLIQPRVPTRRWSRRPHARRRPVHVVRLDGRRLGRAQRQGRLVVHGAYLRRRPGRPTARGTGAPLARHHNRPRTRARLGRAGPLPRRAGRRKRRHAHPGTPRSHVLLLRPGALGHLGHQRRSALHPPRRLAEQG